MQGVEVIIETIYNDEKIKRSKLERAQKTVNMAVAIAECALVGHNVLQANASGLDNENAKEIYDAKVVSLSSRIKDLERINEQCANTIVELNAKIKELLLAPTVRNQYENTPLSHLRNTLKKYSMEYRKAISEEERNIIKLRINMIVDVLKDAESKVCKTTADNWKSKF